MTVGVGECRLENAAPRSFTSVFACFILLAYRPNTGTRLRKGARDSINTYFIVHYPAVKQVDFFLDLCAFNLSNDVFPRRDTRNELTYIVREDLPQLLHLSKSLLL
jgi:hypothetical protein